MCPFRRVWFTLSIQVSIQVYFIIISSNGSPGAELQDKITILFTKNTSKYVYTQQNVKKNKIFKNTHIALLTSFELLYKTTKKETK